jgi:hypothetical protein
MLAHLTSETRHANIFMRHGRGAAADFDLLADGERAGAMSSGDNVTTKAPTGRHVLTRRDGFLSGALQQDLILGAGIARYYLLTRNTKYEELFQLTAEQVRPELKSLR